MLLLKNESTFILIFGAKLVRTHVRKISSPGQQFYLYGSSHCLTKENNWDKPGINGYYVDVRRGVGEKQS